MSLLCLAGKHAARPSVVWNQGLYFSSCRRCGRDMVRADAEWRPVPRGFRIIWKPVIRPEQAGPGEAIRNLPMVIPRGPVGSSPFPAPAAPKRKRHASQQTGFAELVLLGVRLLAWYGAAGFSHWRRNLATRRHPRQTPVLLLAR